MQKEDELCYTKTFYRTKKCDNYVDIMQKKHVFESVSATGKNVLVQYLMYYITDELTEK